MALSRRLTMALSGSAKLYCSQFNKILKPLTEGGGILHRYPFLSQRETLMFMVWFCYATEERSVSRYLAVDFWLLPRGLCIKYEY